MQNEDTTVWFVFDGCYELDWVGRTVILPRRACSNCGCLNIVGGDGKTNICAFCGFREE
jgi:hypothetical protein